MTVSGVHDDDAEDERVLVSLTVVGWDVDYAYADRR